MERLAIMYCIGTFLSLLYSTVFVGKFFHKKPFRNIYDFMSDEFDIANGLLTGATIVGLVNGVMYFVKVVPVIVELVCVVQVLSGIFILVMGFIFYVIPAMERVHERIIIKSEKE